MTEVEITDAGGEKLSMLDFGGFKMSYYGQKAEKIRDVYENLPNFEFREDDIFLTSYPKSGNFSYQSPLILTKLFQHFLSHGMLALSGHDDIARFE